MTTDAILTIDPTSGLYDISIDANGDIANDDFFDTSILYALYGEKRAAPEEVSSAELRRGWIGNRDDFENGSKLWLLSQSRLTRDTLNRIEDEARKALQYLVDDGLAVSIDQVTAGINNGAVTLGITIRRSLDRVDRKFYTLWENSGRGA